MSYRPTIEPLEPRDCLSWSLWAQAGYPPFGSDANPPASAGNWSATAGHYQSDMISVQQPPAVLFYAVINGVLTPQFDYSNETPAAMQVAFNFAGGIERQDIAAALTPPANTPVVVGVVGNYPTAPQADPTQPPAPAPTGFSAVLPSDGMDLLAASVAGFLTAPQKQA